MATNWANGVMVRGSVSAVLAWLTLLLPACSDDEGAANQPLLSVRADCSWNDAPATKADLGRTVAVSIYQVGRDADGNCPQLPAAMSITINGVSVPVAYDPGTTCIDIAQRVTLPAGSQAIEVDVASDGTTLSHARLDGLAPGITALLSSPSDGIVHAGDEIVVVPPPELPTSMLIYAHLYPLQADPWQSEAIVSDGSTRLPDGIHTPMPAFTGTATMVLSGSPYYRRGIIAECSGFHQCEATADHMLGPIDVTEVP